MSSKMPADLPPAIVAGALYDTILQDALTLFLERATFETAAQPSESSLGVLAIEPTSDPCALAVRWFGYRHVLRVPSSRPFTPAEVRMAKAIGAVLQARYRAIFDPRILAERVDLFRGALEDRFVGAHLDTASYDIRGGETRADRIANVIEIMRVAALSTYESRSISTGVLLLNSESDPTQPGRTIVGPAYTRTTAAVKGFYRLADGLNTLFLINRDGRVLNIVDVHRWASLFHAGTLLTAPCAQNYQDHARATLGSDNVCVVLSPTQEIKVFAAGTHAFTFRMGRWELLDVEAKYDLWLRAVGDRALAERLFLTALNLSDAREGALFVVLRDPATAVPQLVAPGDQLQAGAPAPAAGDDQEMRHALLNLVAGRAVTDMGPGVLAGLAAMDGAVVMDGAGRVLAAGAILRHPPDPTDAATGAVQGARTTAAMAASRFGPVLKVSEDGGVTFYDGAKVWDL
jgi:hypothetical protein